MSAVSVIGDPNSWAGALVEYSLRPGKKKSKRLSENTGDDT